MVRVFRHYVPRSLMWLGVGESLVLASSCYIALTLALGDLLTTNGSANSLLPYMAGFVVVMLLSLFASGLYQLKLANNLPRTLSRLSAGVLAGSLLIALFAQVLSLGALTPTVIGSSIAIALLGLVGTRLVFFSLCDAPALQRQILVIGSGQQAQQLFNDVESGLLKGINLCGFVPLDNHQTNQVCQQSLIIPDSNILGLVTELNIDEIVIALDDRRGVLPADQILDCKMRGTRVTTLLDFLERHTGSIAVDSLNPSSMIFSDGYSGAALGDWRKRTFDLVVSSALLIVALPVLALTTAAIWIECAGKSPILYRQQRVGKHGREFSVLKFRSMCIDAEKNGAQWAATQDGRITTVGRFIRQTRIDELPQLLNVFKGEMSFVGPRPERPEFVAELNEAVPYYDIRHNTLPGITGWAQVCYPYGASVDDARRKLQYDLYYMKNHSLFLDLTILFQTVQVCIWSQGAR